MTSLYIANSTTKNQRLNYRLVEQGFVDVQPGGHVQLQNLTPTEATSITNQLAKTGAVAAPVAASFVGVVYSISVAISGIAGVAPIPAPIPAPPARFNRAVHDLKGLLTDAVTDAANRAAA